MTDPDDARLRLAQLYDPQWAGRADLAPYAAMASEFGARRLVDIGCGTGTFACMLAGRGLAVTGVDPDDVSLEIASAKQDADLVRWVHGYARDLPPLSADLATMTANVAQEIVSDEDWDSTLRAARAALRPGGRLVFETRDPAREVWLSWTPEKSRTRSVLPGIGGVEQWFELREVDAGIVTFTGTYIFESDGLRLTPTSSLRFRGRDEVAAALEAAGYHLDEVREAPDRPGLELVFVASIPS